MSSQILSGSSNPSYTNNTGQNVRIVINFMYSTTEDEITLNWAGQSLTEGNIEAIGKNIACASGFYGDFGWYGIYRGFAWWKILSFPYSNSRATLSSQNVAIKYPSSEIEYGRRGIRRFFKENSSTDLAAFSFSIALPLELFLSPGQTFSAVCGSYNILVIKEDGN